MTGVGECSAMEWRKHARALAAVATPPGSRWRGAVESVPRHAFVPRWWEYASSGWELRDGTSDHRMWLEAAYSDQTLVTRVGALHADHAGPGAVPAGLPTSSSTLPGLVVQMYRHASIGDRCTVLDVGTGSGYGTAVLCARLGAARVSAVDVDPYLNSAGRDRLDELGHQPELITTDAQGPLPGRWDRVVAMVSVRTVPPSWLEALHVGGRLVTTLADMGLVLTAEKREDGTAAGRIERDQAMFMHARTGDDYPPYDPALSELAETAAGEYVTRGRYPVLDVVEAWDVRTMLEILAPGIEHHYLEKGDLRVAVMTHEDGSWARAEEREGDVTVHQGGPRRLWDHLDVVRDHWIRHGELPFRGARATIGHDGVITLRRGRWKAIIGR
ncbi:protein-L-isoaspartate(D-aspartate) O-methyltransferase (PCMT) [Nonomuraea fuscirosea]|uniref:Protein-L-isoaspartate O-methyltransferase n=1 Tax=Nonomuraea fuscirosea TaxID=1291556 RepID=A0A2T0NAM4_9ACTN|nr:methyltransferase domain-containing protein [Nonomuraea fuscirosea]PRX70061.1 protein-L-isoaspartate(D-aspartate) O-methyltransferase (PCMT) [Nonomuraea fuscirosea]